MIKKDFPSQEEAQVDNCQSAFIIQKTLIGASLKEAAPEFIRLHTLFPLLYDIQRQRENIHFSYTAWVLIVLERWHECPLQAYLRW